ncbi:MAG: signal peptidase II [Erysipelotrichaceae bacterium]|nr:signal peptidase II [Erysipelotrichaceae bacterium]
MKKIILNSLIVLIADRITKQLVLHYMIEHQSIPIIQKFFYLTFSKNTGVAFSLLEGKVPLIIIMTIIVILLIIKYIKVTNPSQTELICYGLVLGGALGNLIDRVFYGYVIDFLDFQFLGYAFPIFNLADTMIVIGIFLLLIFSIIESRNQNEIYIRRKNKNR